MTSAEESRPQDDRLPTLDDLRALRRPITADDLARLDVVNDGRRYELVDGRIEVFPAAFYQHGRTVGRLIAHLGRTAPDGFEVSPEVGINLNSARTHHRVTDISVIDFVADPHAHIATPPVLAIEVLSAGTAIKDHNTKRDEYARFGIPAYWIVSPDPDDPSITEYLLYDRTYRETSRVTGTQVLRTEVPFPVSVVPYWLVAEEGDWRRHVGGEGTATG